jgi:phosphoethanolamine N-methyltransferase
MSTNLTQRYSRKTALRHERLYGRGYQGPGQEAVFTSLADRLEWAVGTTVLDVAHRHGAQVVGLDASAAMVEIATERQATDAPASGNVRFVQGNVLDSAVLNQGPFDVVWTRDAGAFLTPADKLTAWQRLHRAQPPDGQVLITDYCLGHSGVSETFLARMRAWDQHMITFQEYAAIVTQAGYRDVTVTDQTSDLVASQRDGLRELAQAEGELRAEFGDQDYESLLGRWQAKLSHSTSGQLTWLVLTARVC